MFSTIRTPSLQGYQIYPDGIKYSFLPMAASPLSQSQLYEKSSSSIDPDVEQNRLTRLESVVSTASQQCATAIGRLRGGGAGQIAPFTHPLGHIRTSPDVIVDFDGPDDPYRPANWSFRKKCLITFLYGLATMGSTWASAVYAPGIKQICKEFGVNEEVGTVGISLLLFGFGLGPLIWAPLSEKYGRKPTVLLPYAIAVIFSFATATAKDIQTVLLSRFFCGFFGAAPVTNTGGVLGDLWSPEERGVALIGYAISVVSGTVLGPITGGAIVQSSLGWRWTEYITGILTLFILILDSILLDETYPPALLVTKAQHLRYSTGNWALHARHEEWDVGFGEMANKYLVVPFQLLGTPICFSVALYASFVYGMLYLNLSSFPIQFQEERGWNQLVGQLPFLAFLIGILFGAIANLTNQRFYVRKYRANNCRAVPEARLPPMIVGSVLFAGGLFLLGWTSDRRIPWIATTIGTAIIGFGFFTIFQASLNYLIDTFPTVSASAVAATTFLRSLCAGAFPLFVRSMYTKLGIPWAVSVLGFISIVLLPIPYLFYFYGPKIRAKGRWSRSSL
ncbi:hypothetical protein A7D00_5331 [Trichophyton violaceum]|uniref:Major facilitator superfamily (MFS) profile domain-containing protein n=1 Tax=Trichophyton violaceum TaxID=34388 RepID=A0A178FEK5_TRIVO|nr:hypothetical protein A7D00_5331 [Trichophyton violaceum]